MVAYWSVCNPLTLEDRKKIKEGIDSGLSYGEIGFYVGRPKSTVMRESKRLGDPSKYDPIKAQKDFEQKQVKRRKNPELHVYKCTRGNDEEKTYP